MLRYPRFAFSQVSPQKLLGERALLPAQFLLSDLLRIWRGAAAVAGGRVQCCAEEPALVPEAAYVYDHHRSLISSDSAAC